MPHASVGQITQRAFVPMEEDAGTHEQAFGLARQQMEREGHLERRALRPFIKIIREACVQRSGVFCKSGNELTSQRFMAAGECVSLGNSL